MKYLLIVIFSLFLLSCNQEKTKITESVTDSLFINLCNKYPFLKNLTLYGSKPSFDSVFSKQISYYDSNQNITFNLFSHRKSSSIYFVQVYGQNYNMLIPLTDIYYTGDKTYKDSISKFLTLEKELNILNSEYKRSQRNYPYNPRLLTLILFEKLLSYEFLNPTDTLDISENLRLFSELEKPGGGYRDQAEIDYLRQPLNNFKNELKNNKFINPFHIKSDFATDSNYTFTDYYNIFYYNSFYRITFKNNTFKTDILNPELLINYSF